MKEIRFEGCGAQCCVKNIQGKKNRINYVVMETCHWHERGLCTLKGGFHDAGAGNSDTSIPILGSE
jgi:hypothetical protein